MSIAFFVDGKALPRAEGLPANYSGHILRGSNALHYYDSDLSIVNHSSRQVYVAFVYYTSISKDRLNFSVNTGTV